MRPRERELRDEATHELTSRLLGDAARDVGLALAKSIAADSARALRDAEAKAAIAAIEPHLARALRDAMVDDTLGTAAVAAELGLSRRALEKLVAAGRSPIPCTRANRRNGTRFRREDVQAFNGIQPPPADGVHAQLVGALKRALAAAPAGAPARWTKLASVAALMGVPPSRVRYLIQTGRLPLRPVRIGGRDYFATSAVDACFASRDTTPSKES